MNYDKAHDLAHAMRESQEYKELMLAQEAVKADAEAPHWCALFMAPTNAMGRRCCPGAPEVDYL